jgi:aspartate aminotransferase
MPRMVVIGTPQPKVQQERGKRKEPNSEKDGSPTAVLLLRSSLHRGNYGPWYTPAVTSSRLADRVSGLQPSPTLAITAKAAAMRAQGMDVISFAAGEPDFKTPDSICDVAIEAMRSGFTKYTAGRGIQDLRDTVAEKLNRENGIKVKSSEVIISCGAKHALFNALMALVNPGDEVIIIAPYWMTYSEQVAVAGGIPVLVHAKAENDFVPTYDDVAAAITPKTKVLMLCSPNNPTGAVWPRHTFKELGALAIKHDLWILSDEVYEKLIYEGEHVSPAALSEELASRTITIGSCSKTYAMTGWRIGFAAGPKEAIDAMAVVQDQISHPTSFSMKGAVAAFHMDDAALSAMRDEFQQRRNLMYRLVSDIPGVVAGLPKGAFYIFADFGRIVGEAFADDWGLAEYLLQQAHVAAIPGSVFAAPGYLRFSYATSREDIQRGISRVAEALHKQTV